MRTSKSLILAALVSSALLITGASAPAQDKQAYEAEAARQLNTASRYSVPPGHEPGFQLSIDFPKAMPNEPAPWASINFRTTPAEYMQAVLDYILEGNRDVDWRVGENGVRKWYHAPWMHYGRRGREPIHGLTSERSSRPFELHPQQTNSTNNWAVGFYNPTGGFTLGQVWNNPASPTTESVKFPVGTVSAKLLFTDAAVSQVPYLANSKTWFADINRNGTAVEMRLLQLDIGIRDSRADSHTGWIFGTFMYDADAGGGDVWDRLVPVGLHWGNDPNRTEADFNAGRPLEEGWMNPAVASRFSTLPRKWLGLWGRINGPVDNPGSACLACHSRAMDLGEREQFPPFTPDPNEAAEVQHYFANREPTEPYFAGFRSLDYSLQLADGVANFRRWVRTEFPDHIEDIYGDAGISQSAQPDAIEVLKSKLPPELQNSAPAIFRNQYESPFSRGER
jgi:hypothetical protein